MHLHRCLLLLIPMVYVLIPWWGDYFASLTLHWSIPFLVWAAIIALSYQIDRKRG